MHEGLAHWDIHVERTYLESMHGVVLFISPVPAIGLVMVIEASQAHLC